MFDNIERKTYLLLESLYMFVPDSMSKLQRKQTFETVLCCFQMHNTCFDLICNICDNVLVIFTTMLKLTIINISSYLIFRTLSVSSLFIRHERLKVTKIRQKYKLYVTHKA